MDFQKLGQQAAKTDTTIRPIVKGRTLQHDTDFCCYEVANLDEPANADFKRLLTRISFDKALAGAEFVNAHITLGTKTGRESIATVKPYQDNRDPDKPIKVRVRELRHMLANYTGDICVPVFDLNYEADDIMVMMQHDSIKRFGWESSVIMSGDKDLWMGQGWHCEAKTGRMYLVKGFGHTEYRDVGNVKPKLCGEGRSWFWHQIIMGDRVDDIPGLEQISNQDLDVYFPLKGGKSRKDGFGKCGEAKAYEIMKGVTTDVDAVRKAYLLYVNRYGQDAEVRFMEQAYLLWMQRSMNAFDVEVYLNETCGIPLKFNKTQRAKIKEFMRVRDER